MKKTLAESIRDTLDLITETPADMANALLDLHNESGGKPTDELAADIAADYAGVTAEKLMAAYPHWAQVQANKGDTMPAMDAKKAEQKANWERYEQRKEREAEGARKAAEKEADRIAFQKEQAGNIQAIRNHLSTLQPPAGWTISFQDPEYLDKHTVTDMVISNDAGDIKLVMHVRIDDQGELADWIGGDTLIKFDGKWFTFTDYSKWGDSFMMKGLSQNELLGTIEKEEDRAKASLHKKAARGY